MANPLGDYILCLLETARMRVVCFMAMSINGIVARNRNEDVSAWTSVEDHRFFLTKVREYDAIITGRKSLNPELTYMPTYLLTHHPVAYNEYPNICCVSYTGQDLLLHLKNKGHQHIALLGGPLTNSVFFADNLVDELYITIEPIIFGQGLHFNGNNGIGDYCTNWTLVDCQILNTQGTILLHYQNSTQNIRKEIYNDR